MVNVFVIGMAGSGKTTFLQRLNSELHKKQKQQEAEQSTDKQMKPYILNLDPAVKSTPFSTNIDIRDSVNYDKVMEEYGLGPNGAIITSLNLFATKIDQVVNLVDKRQHEHKYVLCDTPGQIECFIWSASGQIITDAFASVGPTVIAYIVDTPRTATPATFMSNMLYACSILYKTKLPMVIVFNKTDEQDAEFAKTWMTDFLAFQQAMNENGGDEDYMSSLMTSMSLVLEDFYSVLDVVGVSSMTGDGFDEFLTALDKKEEEYEKEYKVERERILKLRQEKEDKRKAEDLTRLLKDVGVEKKDPLDVISDQEEVDDDDDDDYDDVDVSGGEKYTNTSQPLKSDNNQDEATLEKIIQQTKRS